MRPIVSVFLATVVAAQFSALVAADELPITTDWTLSASAPPCVAQYWAGVLDQKAKAIAHYQSQVKATEAKLAAQLRSRDRAGAAQTRLRLAEQRQELAKSMAPTRAWISPIGRSRTVGMLGVEAAARVRMVLDSTSFIGTPVTIHPTRDGANIVEGEWDVIVRGADTSKLADGNIWSAGPTSVYGVTGVVDMQGRRLPAWDPVDLTQYLLPPKPGGK
jgi:hypothetical protein